MNTKTDMNLVKLSEEKHKIVAEFIIEAAQRLDKDVNDIVVGIESHLPVGKQKRLYVDVYDTDFNILERYFSDDVVE